MNCRALIESRFLSMLLHSRSLGLKSFSSILATGGASANPQILKVGFLFIDHILCSFYRCADFFKKD